MTMQCNAIVNGMKEEQPTKQFFSQTKDFSSNSGLLFIPSPASQKNFQFGYIYIRIYFIESRP